MKSKRLMWIATVAVFAVLASAGQLAAQGKNTHKHHQYQLLDLGTFGGPSSYMIVDSQVLSNNGVVAGWADTTTPDPYPGFCFNPDCFVSHAFRWQNNMLTDLGT